MPAFACTPALARRLALLTFALPAAAAAQTPAPVPAPATTSVPLAPPPSARTPRADSLRAANRLDVDGRTAEARAMFAALVASAPDEAARAQARRAMAMSYAFDGDCANAERLEQQVIAYWRTREAAEPQNAFYQQGEMANEAARVCIDAGRLDDAARLYRLGAELGNREPAPRTHPASLWAFRTEHALARLAARRGRAAEARGHVEAARRILDADTAMAQAQRRFLPYLEGYVALYTGDAAGAERHLRAAAAAPGNERDPYYRYLLGEALERQGRAAEARAEYQQAYDLATGHNPPAAFTRPNARRKLAATAPSARKAEAARPPAPPELPPEQGETRAALIAFGPAVVLAFVLEWALTTRAGWPRGRALLAAIAVGVAIALSVQRALGRRG